MYLTSILLIFAVSISTVTPLFFGNIRWPPGDSSIFTATLRAITDQVCTYFSNNTDRAQQALNKIDEGLKTSNETKRMFAQTITYLSSADNRRKLWQGGASCPAFFNEIKDALVADCKNQDKNTASAQQKALQTLISFHNTLKSQMPRG